MGDAPHVHKLRHKKEYPKNKNGPFEVVDVGADVGADVDADAGKQLVVAHRALEATIFPTISDTGEPI